MMNVGAREHHIDGNTVKFFGIERWDGHAPEVPVPVVAAFTAPGGSVDNVEEVGKEVLSKGQRYPRSTARALGY
ncbi:Uncharacterized protein MK0290 [Methanopyrus kandleri AV19]|uniref:Uncharacterized protein n=2 Tax=Methanopyrus kandleri TaxID=2320 RepID=Q8TYK6_METKA|nr:Uncharacterized protein MK0290 [Methanopyrus kandleri AV19]